MHSVFTYGTLQVPAVMQAVTGKDFPSIPGRLNGYQRFRIKDKPYPGIVKNAHSGMDGILYKEIDDYSLELLDEFEDVLYERCLVDVLVEDEDKTESAFVYVVADKYKHYLSNEVWSLRQFETESLGLYLQRIKN